MKEGGGVANRDNKCDNRSKMEGERQRKRETVREKKRERFCVRTDFIRFL